MTPLHPAHLQLIYHSMWSHLAYRLQTSGYLGIIKSAAVNSMPKIILCLLHTDLFAFCDFFFLTASVFSVKAVSGWHVRAPYLRLLTFTECLGSEITQNFVFMCITRTIFKLQP